MSWVALHTSQSVEPHATMCWWPDSDSGKAYAAQRICQSMRDKFPHSVTTWVTGYEYFGARQDMEVALLDYEPTLDAIASGFAHLHESEWPIRPHVTIHNGRQTFTFQWIGLHLPDMAIYWRLERDSAKRGRGNRRNDG